MHYNRKLLIGIVVLALLAAGGYQFFKPNVGARTGGRGATTLGGLTDVSTAGAVNTDVLTFNGATWDPQAGGGGGASVGIFGRMASTTFQDETGARMATGTITIIAAPSGGESSSDNFTIDNGTTSTEFSMFNNAGGGNNFGPGFVQIDVGGGVSQQGFVTRVLEGLQQVGILNVQAKCDSYYDAFDSGAFQSAPACATGVLNGTMSTNTIFLINGVVGTAGNVTITDNSALVDVVGMSGGTN